ncbi:MAG: autotransporter-associated beta strand repeat-containing protein [Rhodanobacter sp.]|jgi:autotransporter-associated beta strand protein|nr:autotransporter-associated beta strand repeat-containing protein [Rhodanobacter sp.]
MRYASKQAPVYPADFSEFPCASRQPYTRSAPGLTLPAAPAFAQVYNVLTNTTQTGNNVLSGTGDVTRNGAGKLILTADNTCTGATSINAGTLALPGKNS